ncbi:polynucleotide 5'-hydroxyl-kinase [Thecamonas trahens ATCC 50062]|uniref:Polynucleotide 5'-hydroxyl-kinase n=1 Tax=Thecamonas trahens ATCC 50062 TaxID=461836 RepID=A0A0L0DMG3_THETB|nr:polynucleotide 5'-hydroxyl-kinase [Thecamonas trahens ATCC 50062]KNC53465.1 polynucleotide 5'-hydroxyl-kinase [Thecamonas trahens ATCC 50062]|eukprot:XP_013761789.1 polynucleotide 5'-hydroxyl-kinase [Thecamonas trahens ATCC 50062]
MGQGPQEGLFLLGPQVCVQRQTAVLHARRVLPRPAGGAVRVGGIDPKNIPRGPPVITPPLTGSAFVASPPTFEMILLVGLPGSGKSHFATTHLVPAGYAWANRDTLGTKAKCKAAAKAALAAGTPVVVDNTNPSPSARAEYIKLAAAAGAPVRVFIFDATRPEAQHMNEFRAKVTAGERKAVPGVAYNMYKKHYVEPSLDEGIASIHHVALSVDFGDDVAREELFNEFT